MTDNVENYTIEWIKRVRSEFTGRFDRIDSTLVELLTQIRVHNTHIAGLVQQRESHLGQSC